LHVARWGFDDLAEVAEEAAVERTEVRRVKPLLSELQVPEWQELAKDRRKWRKMLKSAGSLPPSTASG
jgi:hypothetical protein